MSKVLASPCAVGGEVCCSGEVNQTRGFSTAAGLACTGNLLLFTLEIYLEVWFILALYVSSTQRLLNVAFWPFSLCRT